MQVFMPYPDYIQSVSCLDPSRLGNQIYREALTLLRGGWQNHPASKMWTPYPHALATYCLAGLDELERRGRKYPHHRITFEQIKDFEKDIRPPFMGLEKFHASHRAALLRKFPEWYSQFGWTEDPSMPYFWYV